METNVYEIPEKDLVHVRAKQKSRSRQKPVRKNTSRSSSRGGSYSLYDPVLIIDTKEPVKN